MSEEQGDNGKLEKNPNGILQKTEEQLTSERLTRYTSNPQTFIEISDLICGVVRNPKSQLGVSVFIGNAKRSEIGIGQVELNHRIEFTRRQMDIESEMRKEANNNLIHKPNAMINFARKIIRK